MSQRLDNMPRISEAEFLEKFDETLERIDHENIGFVITRDGRDDMVLCPIGWFLDPLGEGFEDIVLAAVRYACGNPGIATIPRYIQNNLFALSGKTGAAVLKEIERHSELGIEWSSLTDNLRDYVSAINKDTGVYST